MRLSEHELKELESRPPNYVDLDGVSTPYVPLFAPELKQLVADIRSLQHEADLLAKTCDAYRVRFRADTNIIGAASRLVEAWKRTGASGAVNHVVELMHAIERKDVESAASKEPA